MPVEVKETSRAAPGDISNLRYFMSRFNAKNGALIYNGASEAVREDGLKIELIPLWKAFLDRAKA